MSEKPLRHRYPFWLAWPLELGSLAIVALTMWTYLRVVLQIVFQQWPFLLDNVDLIPYAKSVVLFITGVIPTGPTPWEDVLYELINLNIKTFFLFFLAALLRNFLPQLRVQEEGLQVRRGLGWALIPWGQITLVNSMTLPGDRLVMLIQGQRLRLGPWFRVYSLLWGAGLRKGIVVTWHISNFDHLADALVDRLQAIYGDKEIGLVIDDTAYSFLYALLFLPRATWSSLFAPQEVHADAYAHSKWVRTFARGVAGLLLIVAIWRYLGVWWRFLANRLPDLSGGLRWPIIGLLLRTYGRPDQIPENPALLLRTDVGLLLAHVNLVLVVVIVIFVLNLFPDWLLGAEGLAVYVRKQWIQVPWTGITSIRETIFTNGRGAILLQVRRSFLTMWHSLYSLIFGAGLRRGVLFTSLLPGFEQLRERVHLGIVRARESDPNLPERPILEEGGEAEALMMMREPRPTIRRLAGIDLPEAEGGLLKRMQAYVPTAASDVPWESDDTEWLSPMGRAQEEPTQMNKAIRTAATFGGLALGMILFEELLFPPLSRPLAWFALPSVLAGRGPFALVALLVVMVLLTLAEWPVMTFFLNLIAETYDRTGDFRKIFSLYPRTQSPRIILSLILLAIGTTGIVQPIFLLWWMLGALWGAVLFMLTGRELYGWRGLGDVFIIVGFLLFQGITLLIYLVFH